MTHLSSINEQIESDPNDEFCSTQEDSYRNLRLQSFVDRYGIEEEQISSIDRAKRYVRKKYSSLTIECCLNAFLNKIPLIRCLYEYNIRKNLFGDIMAGITIAIMHIPQGMAYGTLTTLPPVHGLYISFFPVILYMIFGTSPHLSIGTFAVISLMTAQAIDSVSLQPMNLIMSNESISNATDSLIIDTKVNIATTLALLVGLIQILLSFLRLGFLTVYLTEPFISGFTTGAAFHVFTSQIPSVFGLKSPRGVHGPFKLLRIYIKIFRSLFSNINWISTTVAFISIIVLYIAKYFSDRYKSKIRIILPSELLLIIVGTTISHFTQFHSTYGVSVVGEIKRGLPPPSLPSFNNANQLIVPAITIAAVSLSISISMAKTLSRKHSYKVSSNQELLAYGMANGISSFFQCYPSAGSLSRSVVQEGSGGKTVLVNGFSSLLLGSVLIALTPLFRSLPMACLAAIIIVNLKGLFLQLKDFLLYFRISTLECILWTMTFVSVVLFDVDIGLYVGICTSFIINTVRTQKPRFFILGQVDNTGIYKSTTYFPSVQQYSNIKILRFDESLYACNAPFFKRKFYDLIGIQLTQQPIISCGKNKNNNNNQKKLMYKYVILECSPFNYIDTVGVKLLIQIFNDLKKRGITLYLSECRYEVRHTLDSMKFYEKTEFHIIYVTTHDAVMSAVKALNDGLI
ncbi:unnamed protein product [Adineta steineri]|uniref:STAS domain-containing protein n=1 Tax=Adineta steineri TaxID=433720 RepID=A0A815D455_9BILA|nr:unnamed protein product [Adineta steineri]CAF3542489.1 unnamed protein product [Adineta steineri]